MPRKASTPPRDRPTRSPEEMVTVGAMTAQPTVARPLPPAPTYLLAGGASSRLAQGPIVRRGGSIWSGGCQDGDLPAGVGCARGPITVGPDRPMVGYGGAGSNRLGGLVVPD